ncbi:energy transducer TonB [Hymenobacter sediminis]|uniref:energy transducer TonB n=1 Tax=Hymenobacter sediminis TaxID=2218621 RepID=UPI000DA6922D|nr:energy transducer TonB [Hymenobacter sediminis]RPD49510.1 energy transducer TonB [Hymenobacter sediminis]
MLPLPILNIRLNACHEDWQQMTPVAQGHHCAQCNRTVLDFTAATQADVDAAFRASPHGRVCGRFRAEQLAPTPQLRPKLWRFLVALVLVCGVGLSGREAVAQVQKAAGTHSAQRKPRLQHKKAIQPSIPSQDTVVSDRIISGDVIMVPENLSNVEDSVDYNPARTYVEQMPEFVGGHEALQLFISQHLRYPPHTSAEGRVFVSFVISKTGQIEQPEIAKGLDPLLDTEALRIIKLLNNKFIPGRQNNRPVAVKYTLPIIFTLK